MRHSHQLQRKRRRSHPPHAYTGCEKSWAWRHFQRSPRVALKNRLKLLISTVLASALWLSETWLPRQQQREHLTSWCARMASSTAGFSPHLAAMDVAQFWRALRRRGHRLLASMGTTSDGRRLSRLHTFAGHLARSSVPDLSLLLRTRCLSWWRREQARCHSKSDGLHVGGGSRKSRPTMVSLTCQTIGLMLVGWPRRQTRLPRNKTRNISSTTVCSNLAEYVAILRFLEPCHPSFLSFVETMCDMMMS